jgi:hypothetical protein
MFVGDFFMTERVVQTVCLLVVAIVGITAWLIDRHLR